MAIGIITGSGTYALPGFEGASRSRWRRRGADGGHARAGSPASRSPTCRATARATCGSPTTSRTARTSARSPQLGVDGVLAVTVCGAVDPARRARLADLLRRPALPVQPAARRLALHVLRRGRRPAARALDLRGPVLARAARGAARRGRRAPGLADARRRLLRPRRRAALQHEGGDPRARRGRRHRGLADRRARDGARRRGASCRSRSSATRPTTPTACRRRRRRSSGCSS